MAIAADPATVETAAKAARRNEGHQHGTGAVTGRASRSAWLVTGVLAVCSLTVLLPLYLTVTMAFKTPAQSVDGNGFSLPAPFNPGSFADAWNLVGFPTAFVISVLVATASVAGVIVLASLAAFAIVRQWDHKLFRYSYFYLLAAMFIPFPVIALPQVKLTAYLSLDNPVGVALLHVMFQLSFSVLLYSAFLRSIPGELEESARIDGATTWQVFWKLIFPLLAPMNATVGIFAFLAAWNDYMMPSLITANSDLQTIPVIQKIFQSSFSTDYNVAFASYLMAMAPTIVVYVFAQRWVMSGMTRGAIK
ncbi:carbohydrate ABC transporter membrane protein 2, CUT1 family [Quadrisphaera granulorum]|uniref:Carbohydrate ABC transporter membrane protein 2 (CUT1 family) n=1 Tax=Quadrisphaera granulorum TaxID=317664 RepID=A0A316AGT5_9ACTN|nr:carbohydrate ABC transporter permease [Quadrisphaera granulorum]PWJ49067.1 carbohydrate ABC transporter membrane protein 2 (CUT1 family) [Quadrisphaera granulorum]SZE98277.1 carbohydrate ABC transporter membrane protein 2, CUT1 family [Quadrisphaera granulorum]